jgi:hypothetical protein
MGPDNVIARWFRPAYGSARMPAGLVFAADSDSDRKLGTSLRAALQHD